MTDEAKKCLSSMFGPAAPLMDLDTCAKVLYKPHKDKKGIAWLPIGWETHQPMLFVQAQDAEDGLILNAIGEKEIIMSGRGYVNMDVLSPELRSAVRVELGLDTDKNKQ